MGTTLLGKVKKNHGKIFPLEPFTAPVELTRVYFADLFCYFTNVTWTFCYSLRRLAGRDASNLSAGSTVACEV